MHLFVVNVPHDCFLLHVRLEPLDRLDLSTMRRLSDYMKITYTYEELAVAVEGLSNGHATH